MPVLAHPDDESLASAAIQILGGFPNRRRLGWLLRIYVSVIGGNRSELLFRYGENSGDSTHAEPHARTSCH